jgi:hypothetical protein
MRNVYFASFAALAVLPAASAPAAEDWAYAWTIETPAGSAAAQVELTPEVYAAATAADLHDVAVVDAAGEPVPTAFYRPPVATSVEALVDPPVFALPRPAQAGAVADNEAIRLQIERGSDGRLRRIDANLSPAAGGGTVAADVRTDLLLDASAIHDAFAALRLDWDDGADTTAQFAVDGSEDLQQWRTLVARATVLRLTQNGNRLDRHEIPLERAHAAYLRLRRLDDGPALAGLATRLRTTAPSSAAHATRQWLTATFAASEPVPAQPGREPRPDAFRYQLPAPLAIEAVKLELADDNSLARVRLASARRSGDAEQWSPRAEFVAFRLRQGDALIGNDEITVAHAAPARDWRIEPATPVAHAPVLSVAYRPDRLAFLAQGTGPYRLVAGSAHARRGDYPVDAALASLRAGQGKDWQPPLATLGARSTLAGETARIAAPAPRDWKSWLLWAVLVGAAVVIAGMAAGLLRERKSGEG